MEVTTKSNVGQGLGIAGFVLGIIALLTAPIPCVGLLALIPGVLGIILSVAGYLQANQANGSKGLIIAALVISIIGTSIAGLWVALFAGLAHGGSEFRTKIERTFNEDFGEDMEEVFEDFGEEIEETFEGIGDDVEEALDDLDSDDVQDMEEVKKDFGKELEKELEDLEKDTEE